MKQHLALRRQILFATCALAGLACAVLADEPFHPPPGNYRTSWLGNSFSGDGGPNGFGYWV